MCYLCSCYVCVFKIQLSDALRLLLLTDAYFYALTLTVPGHVRTLHVRNLEFFFHEKHFCVYHWILGGSGGYQLNLQCHAWV